MSPRSLDTMVCSPRAKHTATVIFMHGLGDSGSGWRFLAEEISKAMPFIKWVLPSAPKIPVTINGNAVMPAWYDIVSLVDNEKKHDTAGMVKSFESIKDIIEQEKRDHGIPYERIVVGGFSQGGAMSLVTMLRLQYKIGGFVCLSGYIPPPEISSPNSMPAYNKETPVFMGHGTDDYVVQYSWGERSQKALTALGFSKIDFNSYSSMAHSACDREVSDVQKFLQRVLGN